MAVRTDEELIAEILNGETATFSELATRHRPRVERLCQRFFSDPEMARDLAQEAFIRAYTALATYRREMPFGSWLRAIVTNLCYDELRRRRRRPEELVADFTAPEVQWMNLVNDATPEEIVAAAEERREAHDLANRLLDSLRAEDRTVLILKDSEEMNVSEIAEIMGWSEAKVKIRAFRARQALRKQSEAMKSAAKRGHR
ncbi:MAG TPA: RNA polymerase sigma factor [Candidatus Binataceae bacterium]|nr:RNA polymerase sigma factor [Candidatus Binataceae bacterium]